jgi:hypothetical protein
MRLRREEGCVSGVSWDRGPGDGSWGETLFSRSENLFSLLDHHLLFLDHMHDLHARESTLEVSNDLNPNIGHVTCFTPR